MRRCMIAAFMACLPGIDLVGQERVITTPQLASAAAAAHVPENDASLLREPAPTLVASQPTFPSLSTTSPESAGSESASTGKGFAGPTVTVTSSLAVVLGLFAGLVWLTRKYGSHSIGSGTLPKAALDCLGSAAIDPRTRVTMLRCGQRILIVAQTQTGIQPLSEITDPEEVRQLTAACSGDSAQSFSSTIRSLENEPAEPGFVGGAAESPKPRRRLFATA